MFPLGLEEPTIALPAVESDAAARRDKRLLALLTDLSLFAALALALSPLLPQPATWPYLAALAGFVIVLSYYYFVGAWLLFPEMRRSAAGAR